MSACIFLCVVDSKTEFSFTEGFFVITNTTTGKFSHPFSAYIISQLPQFSSQIFFLLYFLNPHLLPYALAVPLSWCHLSFYVTLCQSLSILSSSFPLIALFPTPPTQEWIQVSQFHLGHASCLQRSIRLLGNGLLSSSRAFSFGQLGLFALTLKLLLGVCERGDGLE